MTLKIAIICFIASIFFSANGIAQGSGREGGRNSQPGPERLERFRKMRLVEVLNLNEDDAVRFFAKQTAHEDHVRDLMKSRNEILDDMDSAVRQHDETKKVDGLADQLMAVDKKIFEERQRYQNDVRQMLTSEQFGKFLVFERNFGRQVRDALEEMHQDRPERPSR